MRKLISAVAFTGTLAIIGGAAAQTYPSRPIAIIAPFAAGGPSDTRGRIIPGKCEQPRSSVTIENVSGPAGNIGVGRVAHAMPEWLRVRHRHLENARRKNIILGPRS
jgi:tripartite-type tricarboxylate transporter receptor subunit TctC